MTGLSMATSRRMVQCNWICVMALAYFTKSTQGGEGSKWEKDLSSQMKIDVGTDGFDFIRLRCQPDAMTVDLVMEDDFSGVIYTRGNFYDRKSSCFLDPDSGTQFKLRLPFDTCEFKKDNETYTTTLIIQHDDMLIFPGDLAFEISCDLRPQEFVVSSILSGPETGGNGVADVEKSSEEEPPPLPASISLADPDPAAAPLAKHRKSTLTGDRGEVTFTPGDVRPRRQKQVSADQSTETPPPTMNPRGTVIMEKLEL